MLLKKLTAGIVSLGLIGTVALTSALAANDFTKKQAYGENYDYSGNSNNLKWNYIGNDAATTVGSNSSNNTVERYIYVYVAKKNKFSNAIITYDKGEVTTRNAGTTCTVLRNKTDKNVYFDHYSYIKTDRDNNVRIYTSPEYRVYQES